MDWQNKAKAYRDEFIEDLKTFLSIDSVEDMSTAKEEKPFGEGVAEALSFMLERGEADGFKTKHIQGYAGYIEYGEGEEEVGVLVHVDVVPAGDGWTTPPFSPDIRDGRIYARGAIDDKGPAMAAYYALKIVRDSGLPVAKRIRLIIGTDEESGWLCMDKYDELEGIPAVGFSPDGEFPIINAEKGQINAVLVLAGGSDSHGEYGEKNDKWTLVSFASGERYNMVPDEATARVAFPGNCAEEDNFGRLKNDYAYFLCDCKLEGSLNRDGHTLVFSLKGRPAHGSEPYNGLNAGLLLAQFLHQYPFSGKGGDFLQLLAATLYDDFYGEKLGLACGDEVIGKLTVNPGVLHYSEENGAGVKLNIRYPATVSAQERIGLLRTQVRELGWKVESLRSSNAHYVPEDHPVVRTLQRVYEVQTGEKATLLSVGGATYAKLMKDGVAFGAVFPGKAMTAHERDEYAEIDDLIKAMSIYAQAIYELARP